MSIKSNIEWTETTWNPVTGCSKITSGCKHCYAYRMTKRLKAMGQEKYKNGFEVHCHDYILNKPFNWKKPRQIFVNSMSDLYHKEVPSEFIIKVFKTMHNANWHVYQILTKRANRLAKLSKKLPWSENIWQGVTVENQVNIGRIDHLAETNANVKFISFEPLIGRLDTKKLNLDNIDWVIVGGESGPKARPMKKEWVLEIRNACIESEVPFFFKQWGGTNRKKNGRKLKGRTWDEYPNNIALLNKNLKKYYS